jgi:hypothetical protein
MIWSWEYPRGLHIAYDCILSIMRATFEHSTDCTCCDFGQLCFDKCRFTPVLNYTGAAWCQITAMLNYSQITTTSPLHVQIDMYSKWLLNLFSTKITLTVIPQQFRKVHSCFAYPIGVEDANTSDARDDLCVTSSRTMKKIKSSRSSARYGRIKRAQEESSLSDSLSERELRDIRKGLMYDVFINVFDILESF